MSASPVVAGLAARLLCRADGVAAALVATIEQRTATYAGDVHGVDYDDLLDSCRTNIVRMCQTLSDRVPPGEDPLDAPHATGARRAEQSVPLEELLQSYRQCGRLVWEGLVEELNGQPGGEPRALLDAAGDVWSVMDVYSHAVGEGYRAREAELRKQDLRLRAELLLGLVAGQQEGPVGRAADALGLPAVGPYVCVVIPVPAAQADGRLAVRTALLAAGIASAWAARGGSLVGLVALAHPCDRAALAAALAAHTEHTGVSPAFDGLLHAPDGHRLAQLAMRTLSPASTEVAWLEERLPEALLTQSPDLAALLATRTLGALDALPEPERQVMRGTLTAYLSAGGSATATARVLWCHRNTVINRLARLEELTGGSLRDFRHLVVCSLALSAASSGGAAAAVTG